ncbi:YybH family protein [Bacteroidota bacterium]
MNNTIKHLFCLLIISIIVTNCNMRPNQEQEKGKLLQTDIDFSNRSAEVGNHQAFLEFASPDVVLLKPNSYPIVGKLAMKKLYEELSDSGYKLTWKPSYGRVAASGDLGYTFGIYLLEIIEGEQKGQVSQGTYCSIWEKNVKGKWRFILDTGNPGLGSNNSEQ